MQTSEGFSDQTEVITGGPVGDVTVPLCVDLDGTLVKSDTLVDSVLVLCRQDPGSLLRIPRWLFEGKAAFKGHVASHASLDAAHLPYNRELIQYLEQQHAAGRPLYLATAADCRVAMPIAEHLGFFTGVLCSDGKVNLAGAKKLATFRERFGERFSYIGNAGPDAPVLAGCVEPMLANPSRGLSGSLSRSKVMASRTFTDRAPALGSWLRAVRLHQWAKNALVFLPLLLAHDHAPGLVLGAVLAFLSFGLCASATYILNDLLDVEADRKHHRKRRRPFAAGDLPAAAGCAVIVLFLLASVGIALLLPHAVARLSPAATLARPYEFLKWLLIYAVTTTAYSLRLKRVVIVDVIILSGLYTVRIIAGSAATGIMVSTWLAGFSIFFFLSLAFVKRFAELESLVQRNAAPANGRGYLISDIEQLRSFGSASGYASVVVLTLYISNLDAVHLYRHTTRLWLLVPVLLLWLSRLWLLASRGQLNEDPVVYAITDRRSLLLGAVVALIVLLAL